MPGPFVFKSLAFTTELSQEPTFCSKALRETFILKDFKFSKKYSKSCMQKLQILK